MKRLLVANRGEIAVRIIRACREAGVSPVAVYSEPDRDAPFVGLADAAVCLGSGPATESYLNQTAVLEAARTMNADAIHPGYGFLSENAAFAQHCTEAGFIFVGPPAEVIRALGDKSAAKKRMEAAGVPTVPGYNGVQEPEILRQEAEKIGFPLLIKAAAGGGGRGMRVVTESGEFATQLNEAKREARSAFGDDRVLLERCITRPRHIEFQIFGDTHGNLVHLFERECSIQRRHQKIIEESPAPVLTPELRAKMAAAAVAAGKAAGYINAGTVEFLLEEEPDGNHEFYFLEVNTRLQVEHPVTEAVTGLDLVRLQLQVADGLPLPFTQAQVHQFGHAIEVRIYAEDAATGFLPSVGTLAQWIEPNGPGVRVDSGVVRGSTVLPYYDPMLAKLIVHAATREQAIDRLRCALQNFYALGVQTNIAYLLAIIQHPEFRAGNLSTRFLTEHFAQWKPDSTLPDAILLALAAHASGDARHPFSPTPDTLSLWQTTDAWRNA